MIFTWKIEKFLKNGAFELEKFLNFPSKNFPWEIFSRNPGPHGETWHMACATSTLVQCAHIDAGARNRVHLCLCVWLDVVFCTAGRGPEALYSQ